MNEFGSLPAASKKDLFSFLLRLADDRLILGHRLSEWCGYGPILEEDIALANLALDLIGQAKDFFTLAAQVESKSRTADDLAYFRDERQFMNLKMLELPRGDFAFSVARQFLFDVYSYYLMLLIKDSAVHELAALAERTFREDCYHLRHSASWVLRLGDGTETSKRRIQNAFNDLWMYSAELFEFDKVEEGLMEAKIIPDLNNLRDSWTNRVQEVLNQATLEVPSSECYMLSGCRQGLHTEHLGHLLSEMQILQRSYPGLEW